MEGAGADDRLELLDRLAVVAAPRDDAAERGADARLQPVGHVLVEQPAEEHLRVVEIVAETKRELGVGEPQLALLRRRHGRAGLEVLGIDT